MTRTEKWKDNTLLLKVESENLEKYIAGLEEENYNPKEQISEFLLKVKTLEIDKGILEIKLKYLEDGKA